MKSDVITLPVLVKDEKKYSECVDVLDQLDQLDLMREFAVILIQPKVQINLLQQKQIKTRPASITCSPCPIA